MTKRIRTGPSSSGWSTLRKRSEPRRLGRVTSTVRVPRSGFGGRGSVGRSVLLVAGHAVGIGGCGGGSKGVGSGWGMGGSGLGCGMGSGWGMGGSGLGCGMGSGIGTGSGSGIGRMGGGLGTSVMRLTYPARYEFTPNWSDRGCWCSCSAGEGEGRRIDEGFVQRAIILVVVPSRRSPTGRWR